MTVAKSAGKRVAARPRVCVSAARRCRCTPAASPSPAPAPSAPDRSRSLPSVVGSDAFEHVTEDETMAEAAPAEAPSRAEEHEHALHEELEHLWETPHTVWGELSTVDHKKIGVRYLYT